jgi:hypothetical protein
MNMAMRRHFICAGWVLATAVAHAGEPAALAADAPVVKLEPVTVTASATWFLIADTAGRVMLRPAEAGGRMRFAKVGAEFSPGDTITTGERSRFELIGANDARWRLGGRTAFLLRKEGARLLAGTALAVVPDGETWTVDTFGSRARIGGGTWILHAVENEGLKVICLDGPARLETDVAADAAKLDKLTPAGLKMKPGELIFLRPGARGFGPLVTIYLGELLATSRLVVGFKNPLPRIIRLQNLGIAQSEQLKGVSSALVAGAKSQDGFDVYLPGAPVPASGLKTDGK